MTPPAMSSTLALADSVGWEKTCVAKERSGEGQFFHRAVSGRLV